MTTRTGRLLVLLTVAALAAGAVHDFARLGAALPWRTMDDFPDFYCAGSLLDRGENPYTYEPLRTCEHRVNAGDTFRGRLFASNPAIAVPAPQPAYDFLPFMALARLPFPLARVIGGIAIAGAALGSALALAALGVPLALAVAVFALSAGYAALNTGQIVPFALLALTLCGLALARRRDGAAGVFAGLTSIEPSLGLPVILATLIFAPRARLATLATLGCLLLLTCAIVGLGGAIEYVTAVLPAHARSELRFPFQYSLTYALAQIGVPAATALAAGAVSYVALAIAGLFVAPRAAARTQRRELLVFLPALCSVIGGAFVHQEELCFALPALTVLALYAKGRLRVAGAVALCVVAIPWIAVWGAKQLFLSSVLVCALILLQLRLPLRTVVATFAAIGAAIYCLELAPPHLPVPTATRAYARNELVQREWSDYTAGRSTRDALWYAIKLPTWTALLAVLGIAAFRFRGASESSPES